MSQPTKGRITEAGTDRFYNAVSVDGHDFAMDEPTEMGGTDQGPSPFALVVAALGACTNMTLRMYADMKQWPLDQVQTEVVHTPSKEGHHFLRSITLEGTLDASQRLRLLEIANKCPVHKLLEGQATVESSLTEEAS